jgi:hypothetical protein
MNKKINVYFLEKAENFSISLENVIFVSEIKGGILTEGVCEEGAEEDIWTEEG